MDARRRQVVQRIGTGALLHLGSLAALLLALLVLHLFGIRFYGN